MRPGLTPWICSQKACYQEHLSDWECPPCGVTQRTVLGPVVFPALIIHALQAKTNHWKFADDVTVVLKWPLHQPCTLQQTLNGLHTWAENHKMKHNPKKCKVVHAFHPPAMPTLSINQNLLKARDTVLGVTCDRTVRWTTCWPQPTENSLLCVAFRKFGVKDSELLSIYTGCKCPVLEHIASVWHSFLTADQSNRAEKKQKRSL